MVTGKINRLGVRPSVKSFLDLSEDKETIYAVDEMNSVFDEDFSVDAFDKIANGRPLRRMCAYGIHIGSSVMGGAAKYFIQFC